MQLFAQYTHRGGIEILKEKGLWKEIRAAIDAVDARVCKKDKPNDRYPYSLTKLNKSFENEFMNRGWSKGKRYKFHLTERDDIIREVRHKGYEEQRKIIAQKTGRDPSGFSHYQPDFEKDRAAVEVQLSGRESATTDILVQFRLLHELRELAVGVEILPMKFFQDQLNLAAAIYERTLHGLLLQEANYPPFPVALLGIAP